MLAQRTPHLRFNNRPLLRQLNEAAGPNGDPAAALALEVARREGTLIGTESHLQAWAPRDAKYAAALAWWYANTAKFSA